MLEEINQKISDLQDERVDLFQKLNILQDELRKFPSNNELRKKSSGNKDKFERLKSERDLQCGGLKEGIEKAQGRINKISEEIVALRELPAFVDFMWETEGRVELEKNLSEEMLEHLQEEGFSKDFLFERAKTSSLAREILVCYESPRYGRGYVGYSMSVNAWQSQENRVKPISKWSKEDLVDFNSLFGTKTTLKKLKEFLVTFGKAEKHHTSKFYNETMFYSLPLAILYTSKKKFVERFGEVDNFTINKERK